MNHKWAYLEVHNDCLPINTAPVSEREREREREREKERMSASQLSPLNCDARLLEMKEQTLTATESHFT